ncbi:MAG: Trk system potassium transporter TrkA [Bacteroidales bacterium]|jgi:trk system potassium uptake protein TrkA|nr:Trk system potassium transporter TrkA [Bacteroidales bacterium]
MKIIIAGAGEVGSHLAKMLSREANDITIIESDETKLDKLSELADVVTVHGDPTSIPVLRQAGAAKADLFIAVGPAQTQNTNIISSLLAKKMGAKKVTARINNDEYLEHDNKLIFTELGIDLLFYPEKMAAYEIIDLLKETGTSEFMDFARGKLQMAVFRLDDGAPLINKTLNILSNGHPENKPFKPVAIARGNETIIPNADTKFQQGDLIFMVCKKEGFQELMIHSGKYDIDVKNLMIVGGGRIAEMLCRKMLHKVDHIKVIEARKERCEYLAEALPEVVVINGDARNTDLLVEEDAGGYDAFVAVTSSSETNILSCVAVKNMGVPKVIAEVENLEYITLAEDMGIDAVINKKLVTAGRIFRFTLSNKVRSIKCLNGSDAEVLEFIANPESAITKSPIKDLKFPKEAIIGGIIRGEESIIANSNTVVAPYDRVVVFALPQVLAKVNKFFL